MCTEHEKLNIDVRLTLNKNKYAEIFRILFLVLSAFS